MTTTVLFLCTHNSARSQMAEGLLRQLGGPDFEVHSAGTVATEIRPEAIQAMAEIGIDISGQESKTVERYLGQVFDEAITVCDPDCAACPYFPSVLRHRYWPLDDPASMVDSPQSRLDAFRQARDTIRARIEAELL